MIGLSLEVYDILGARIFHDADTKELLNESGSRRCTRTATLDGGCDVYDTGYSVSDNSILIREENASKEVIEYVKYILQNYGTVIISTKDGVFEGVPNTHHVNRGNLEFNILITEKLSE